MLARIERAIYVVAAIAGVLGVAFWVLEAPDREQEREARRSELVARANETLRSAGASGVLDSQEEPGVDWAIRTLITYQQPVVLRAPQIHLNLEGVRCAVFDIRADTLTLGGSYDESVFVWTGDKAKIGVEGESILFALRPAREAFEVDYDEGVIGNLLLVPPSAAEGVLARDGGDLSYYALADTATFDRRAFDGLLGAGALPQVCQIPEPYSYEGGARLPKTCAAPEGEMDWDVVARVSNWHETCQRPRIRFHTD